MEAFRRAVEAGYGMELDVHVTKDNVPVVFHDFNLKRMCGVDGVIEDYTYEELQEFTLGSYHDVSINHLLPQKANGIIF